MFLPNQTAPYCIFGNPLPVNRNGVPNYRAKIVRCFLWGTNLTGPGTEFSFPFSLDEDGGAGGVSTTKESSWLFVEWFVVKKNGMIFSKDVRQLLLVVHSSVRIYHFFDRFIYSDPPDCLDSSVHSVSKSQNT